MGSSAKSKDEGGTTGSSSKNNDDMIYMQGATDKNSSWNKVKDRFIIGQRSRWKAIFDIWMLVLVGYSCFSTIY